MKYPLSFNTWNSEEKRAVIKVLNSGNFTMGSEVNKFENNFANYFKSKYAVMVNSGSSANLLMLSALRYCEGLIKKKNKPNIIVPSVGWSTSYFPISQNGFKLNFVDIDQDTLNIDTKKIENSIDNNTVAILAINLLGNPCNFEKLKKISKKYNLLLLEDNCESMGAKYNNKFSGTFGKMSSHSLFFAHHMQTMEGGVILTDDTYLKDFLKSLRAHGWCRNLPKKNKIYKFSNDDFLDKFVFVTPGYSLRPLEMEGAVGSIQLRKLKKFLKIRLDNAKIFKHYFENKEWCSIQKEEKNSTSSWYGFNILLKGSLANKRKKIVDKLLSNKIEVRPTMTGDFTKNPVIKYLDYKCKYKLNSSINIDQNGFFVGNYPKDLSKEIEQLFNYIKKEVS